MSHTVRVDIVVQPTQEMDIDRLVRRIMVHLEEELVHEEITTSDEVVIVVEEVAFVGADEGRWPG